jgi:ATP-dependent Clp protease ATP-binding subunit ClpA
MYVDDLEIPMDKLAETARRVMGRAVEESRRREHSLLTSAHLFFAVALAEWDLFAQAMRDAGVNPHLVVRAVDEHLRRMPPFAGSALRVSHPTKLVCKLAHHRGCAQAVRPSKPPTCCSRCSKRRAASRP